MASNGPSAGERFLSGILPENPVYRQLLGMCPTLAVTANLQAAITMAVSTWAVLLMANIIISMIRGLLKPHLRILVFTLTIATFVTIVDKSLAAFLPTMSKELGPYIPLIIVNCLIISRCEICASKQGVFTAIADACGMGLGFTLALASIAGVRELLGSGTLFKVAALAELTEGVWPRWAVMILPPGAFFTLGLLLALVNWWGARKPAAAKAQEG